MFLCENFNYREAEHENGERYFFHSNLFYVGTAEDGEKLQGGIKKEIYYLRDSSNVFKLDVKIFTDMASRIIPKNFRKM